jgi:tetratricopeptide (TPR) repeat protein
MFREAAQLDPTFAAAYAGLAQALAFMIFRYQARAPEFLDDAQRASDKALELEPNLAEAWVARGILHMMARQKQQAARAFEQAVAIDPRSFDVHYFHARFLVTCGDHAGAIREYERAFEIDETSYVSLSLLIQEYQALHDEAGARHATERAWTAIEKRLALDPDDSGAYDHGANVLMLLSRPDESRRFSDRAIALRPDDGATLYNAACRAALSGDIESAFRLLERSIDLGYGHVDWMSNDNDLVPLHSDPRFGRLQQRLRAMQAPSTSMDRG